MGGSTVTGVGQVALHVTSITESERFYGDVLGLEHLYTYGDLAFFACGQTRIYLQGVSPDQWAPGTLVYLQVADIAAAHDRLRDAGVAFQQTPTMIHEHADGTQEWMAFFTDPSSNQLAIMSQTAIT